MTIMSMMMVMVLVLALATLALVLADPIMLDTEIATRISTALVCKVEGPEALCSQLRCWTAASGMWLFV